MRIEVSYQCEIAQQQYDAANKDTIYVFNNEYFKVCAALSEAKKYGHGILHIVNGYDLVRYHLF